jgi:hypothetical protein
MPVFTRRTRLRHPAEAVYAWHARPGAFARLAPPWERIRVIRENEGLADGASLEFEIRKGPFRIRWVAEHEGHVPGRRFIDRQLRGPAASWVHVHTFEPDGDGSFLDDRVEWTAPLGALGRLGHGLANREIERMFTHRHARTAHDLDRHAPFADRPRLTVAITGASGLVGTALAAFLTTGGHQVVRVARDGDPATLDGVDAVVHLAGEPIAQRWTADAKRRIVESRVEGTTRLARGLAALPRKPRVLVSASAVGIYGDRGDERITEDSPPGRGFLADTARAWESAADPARDAGIRVVHPRIGIVLDAGGGALAKLRPIYALGAGGPVGTGRQGFSFVSLDDLVAHVHHALWTEELVGPVNATAPNPVSQAEFARALGRVLRRPAVLPVPGLALRALYGQMAREALLEGHFVFPERALASGFAFAHPTVEEALRWALGR